MAAELHAAPLGDREKSSVEQRRHVRVEVRLEVVFSIADEKTRTLTRAFTHDISHGGACLAVTGCSDRLLEKLADLPLLDIMIDIPRAVSDHQEGAVLLSLRARVEWVCRAAAPGTITQVGLEFRNLDSTTETAIIDLIAHLLLSSGDPLPTHRT